MIPIWVPAVTLLAGILSILYLGMGSAPFYYGYSTRVTIARAATGVIGVSILMFGIVLLSVDYWYVRTLGFFGIGTGAQIVLWSAGIRLELLGSASILDQPRSDRDRLAVPRSDLPLEEFVELRARLLHFFGLFEAVRYREHDLSTLSSVASELASSLISIYPRLRLALSEYGQYTVASEGEYTGASEVDDLLVSLGTVRAYEPFDSLGTARAKEPFDPSLRRPLIGLITRLSYMTGTPVPGFEPYKRY